MRADRTNGAPNSMFDQDEGTHPAESGSSAGAESTRWTCSPRHKEQASEVRRQTSMHRYRYKSIQPREELHILLYTRGGEESTTRGTRGTLHPGIGVYIPVHEKAPFHAQKTVHMSEEHLDR